MRTKNPLIGLLLYFWYSTGGKLMLLFLQTIAWGIAFLIFGDREWGVVLHIFFGINALLGVSMLILSGMGNREVEWERFQLSMPVRRRDLASSQYTSVGLAPLIGLPVFILFTAMGAVMHEGVYFTAGYLFVSTAPFLATPYIMGGLIFPVYSIPAVERVYEGMFPALMAVSIAIPHLLMRLGTRLGWSPTATSSALLVVTLVVFAVSYCLTKRVYERMDF